ncbi:ATP-dependent zinc metalloprotease FtsH [Atopobium fossor]|uniref:ATP-dependent zinc metalloprotease FtsH n=1 Tax=Atopobium fossor TaxID=39487 RepID=UPI00041BBA7E|nr:ATP-dependent zinc metalloprotease FtsH [Atopobium fossor]
MSLKDDKGTPREPRNPRDPFNGDRQIRIPIAYVLIGIAFIAYLVFALQNGLPFQKQADKLATSEVITAIKEDRVSEVTYRDADGFVKGKYWKDANARGKTEALSDFTSTYVGADSLAEQMAKHPKVKYVVDTSKPNALGDILLQLIPTVLMVGAVLYFLNQMMAQNSQAMQFGKAKARITEKTRPKVKFKDVAGIDEAVEELKEIRDFLAEPKRFLSMGARIPRGVLLVGPPGTGKTLLAKAVAGEAGVPFFSISGSDFVEMYVGVGASRVRDLFKEAKEAAPCIIFIDEIDAVGRQRGAGLGGGHDEREQTLNQLLVEMDGFEQNEAVILVAATNRPDILDPALLRPGRFDRQVTVDRPDVRGREKILKVHSEGKPLEGSIDFANMAKLTPGFTGADLSNLMNESALLAARRNKKAISQSEVEEAMERIIAGPERKSRVITQKERKTIAYHESGHALIGHLLDNSDPVHKISIISRGQALGYTLQLPDEDRFLQSRSEMLDEIVVLLGGRTAEELFCGDITTGASNDLERATKLARNMVTRYGMSDALGTRVFGEAQHQVFLGRDYADKQDYSSETAKRIDDEVERIMREAHERATQILSNRREQMDTMAQALLERETVEGDAMMALLNNTWEEYQVAEAHQTSQADQTAQADQTQQMQQTQQAGDAPQDED